MIESEERLAALKEYLSIDKDKPTSRLGIYRVYHVVQLANGGGRDTPLGHAVMAFAAQNPAPQIVPGGWPKAVEWERKLVRWMMDESL
jgi:hypothetical protein